MPVDLYVGGAEHAVLHLLYSRFWHKVLFDRGLISTPEPFHRLVNQGMILGEVEYSGYVDDTGQPISSSNVRKNAEGNRVTEDGRIVENVSINEVDIEKKGEGFVLKADPSIKVDSRAHKMSKSRGNVVNPDAVVREYGADALRLYEMFMGPLEATKPWSMTGVGGVRNFLDRVWRMIVDDQADDLKLDPAVVNVACDEDQLRMLHQTIKKVTEDIESMSFNTAIARMMEFTNFFTRANKRPEEAMKTFLILLAPYAPHICEELWALLGESQSIAKAAWPNWDENALVETSVEVPVQINGKVKAKIRVATDANKDTMLEAAMSEEKIKIAVDGKDIVKKIVVPGRLINLVVK
jgi:leucyl-tRNA synthetase